MVFSDLIFFVLLAGAFLLGSILLTSLAQRLFSSKKVPNAEDVQYHSFKGFEGQISPEMLYFAPVPPMDQTMMKLSSESGE